MSFGVNPQVTQGLLNRVRTHIVVTNQPQLNVTAPYMGKQMAQLTFEDDFVEQIKTGTGIVNSPEVYVMGQIVINLLRSQPLAALWLAQSQQASVLGPVTAFSDTSTFPPVTLNDCSIMRPDPGTFDGTDPIVKITVKGVYYTNAKLWSA